MNDRHLDPPDEFYSLPVCPKCDEQADSATESNVFTGQWMCRCPNSHQWLEDWTQDQYDYTIGATEAEACHADDMRDERRDESEGYDFEADDLAFDAAREGARK